MECKTLMNKLAVSRFCHGWSAVQHVVERRTRHTRPSSVPLHRLRSTEQTAHGTNRGPQQLAERLAMTGITEAAGSATLVMYLPSSGSRHPGARPWVRTGSERLQHLLLRLRRAKKSTVAHDLAYIPPADAPRITFAATSIRSSTFSRSQALWDRFFEPTARTLINMSRSLGALAVLCALLLASSSVQAARTLQASTCTVKLRGGLDKIAGKTDITLSHDCGLGYSQTDKVAGELTDFYQ